MSFWVSKFFVIFFQQFLYLLISCNSLSPLSKIKSRNSQWGESLSRRGLNFPPLLWILDAFNLYPPAPTHLTSLTNCLLRATLVVWTAEPAISLHSDWQVNVHIKLFISFEKVCFTLNKKGKSKLVYYYGSWMVFKEVVL